VAYNKTAVLCLAAFVAGARSIVSRRCASGGRGAGRRLGGWGAGDPDVAVLAARPTRRPREKRRESGAARGSRGIADRHAFEAENAASQIIAAGGCSRLYRSGKVEATPGIEPG
jgi:hypothetical protein